jgi:hypothetical protein
LQPRKYKHYISLGFNCEVSFALESSGLFESSLYSWADVRGTDSVIYGIENPDKILTGRIVDYSGNMFFCENSRIGFHGKTAFADMKNSQGVIDQIKREASLHELTERTLFLRSKLKKALEEGSSLLIVKHFSDIFAEKYSWTESAAAVAEALRRFAPESSFDLLYVMEGPAPENLSESPHLFGRWIPKFSPRSAAKEIDKAAWTEMLAEFI